MTGVSPTGPGYSRAEPEEVSALRASIPNAAWLPMSLVPRHGRRIYALARGGRALIVYANPELERGLYLAWWPLPEHAFAASAIEAATAGETTQIGSTEGESATLAEGDAHD